MKQVININFHGQVVPIEVSAFDILKNYTDSLARFFANEEGKEEIINDIESRIGELFQEKLKKGATCITDDDVNAIIKSMGRPEEFDGEEEKVTAALGGNEKSSYSGSQHSSATNARRLYRDENHKVLGGVCSGLANYFGTDPIIIRIVFVLLAFAGAGLLAYIVLWIAVPSTASTEVGGMRKKLYRDPDDKIIAGVCSGIGNYFGVSAWVPRVFFLLPFLSFVFNHDFWAFGDFPDFFRFSFSPGSLIIYIVLWLVFPEASTTAEKLEMKGEKVDMNSIKNSVMEEMKGVQQRAEKFAKEATAVAGEKGKVMGTEIRTAAKRSGRSLGDVIVFLIKGFAYFIIGCVSLFLVGILFTIAIASISVFPFKGYLLTDGWQNIFAWGTLLFFIAVPVIGIITWIIRRLAKMKSNRKLLRGTFIGLWIVGWVCVVFLLAFVTRDFKSTNRAVEEEVSLSNPGVSKLEITANYPHRNRYYNGWIRVDDDTAYVRNIGVVIEKSPNDSFKVTIKKIANGNTKNFADTTARQINFKVMQLDSMLVLDKEIAFSKNTKFRNQGVIVTVYVPVGKKIRLDESIGRFEHVNFGWHDEGFGIQTDHDDQDLEKNKDFIMKADGFLYDLNGKRADGSDRDWDREEANDNDNDSDVNRSNGNPGKAQNPGTDNYRYDNKAVDNIDSLRQKVDQEKKRTEDSIRRSIEESQKQLQKLQEKKQTAGVDKNEAVTTSSFQMPLFIHL